MTDDEVALLIDRCRAESESNALREIAAVREAAKSFTTAETSAALRAVTAAPFPGVPSFMDPAGGLVTSLVFANPAPELVTVLREIIPALEPLGRGHATRVTGQIGTADAYKLVVESLETFLPDGGLQIGFSGVLYWLVRRPRHPEVVFPRLFSLRRFPEVSSEIDDVVAAYLKAGLLSPRDLAAAPDVVKSLLKRFRAGYSSLTGKARRAANAGRDGWWRAEKYQQQRHDMLALIELVGYLEDANVQRQLEALATIADPRLGLAATAALLRQGHAVPDQTIDALAADPETRVDLYGVLRGLDMTARFPQAHYTQPAFAESRMYTWLSHAGELGRPADEIETMAAVELLDSPTKSSVRYFIVRFRAEGIDASGEQWLAGVFGPCHPSDPPEDLSGLAFSDFEAFDAATPAEHASRIGTQVEAIIRTHSDR